MVELVLSVSVVVAVGAALALWRRGAAARREAQGLSRERDELQRRFATVLDLEAEATRVRETLAAELRAAEAAAAESRAALERETADARRAVEAAHADLVREEAAARTRKEELSAVYSRARETLHRLEREVALVEENLEDISFGIYRPHYEFATSADYKARLDRVWQEQKDLIRANRAIRYGVAWTIGDSRREGERMQKQYGKLLMRAFNGECDASIAKVAWNNVTRMEERIQKGFVSINELGGVMQISITLEYRELRLQELRLHYELEEKKRAEVEEQRRQREEGRDRERAMKELEKARLDAEEEEHRHERALEKARKEMAKAKDSEAQLALTERIRELEFELEEAHREKERAISRAQLTRSGHVYVISNVGSFGDEVVKIGMTRRLDPRDRIKELGDASVPFDFDVHGLVYSEDAPALEGELHRQFADRRVNLVNLRREFFRVRLEEVDEFLRARSLKLELTLLAEAREFRETRAIRDAPRGRSDATASPVQSSAAGFPDSPFDDSESSEA